MIICDSGDRIEAFDRLVEAERAKREIEERARQREEDLTEQLRSAIDALAELEAERVAVANKLEAIAKHLSVLPDEDTIAEARGALETLARELAHGARRT